VKVLASSQQENIVDYLGYQPNFVECSPSCNSKDDERYNSNSSAVKSILTISSAFKNAVESISHSKILSSNPSNRRREKEEDLDPRAIGEQEESDFISEEDNSSRDIHFQLS